MLFLASKRKTRGHAFEENKGKTHGMAVEPLSDEHL